jgi:hypothetical protein
MREGWPRSGRNIAVVRVALHAMRRQAASHDCPENRAPLLHRFLCTRSRPHLYFMRLALYLYGPGAQAQVGTAYAKRRAWREAMAVQERRD